MDKKLLIKPFSTRWNEWHTFILGKSQLWCPARINTRSFIVSYIYIWWRPFQMIVSLMMHTICESAQKQTLIVCFVFHSRKINLLLLLLNNNKVHTPSINYVYDLLKLGYRLLTQRQKSSILYSPQKYKKVFF